MAKEMTDLQEGITSNGWKPCGASPKRDMSAMPQSTAPRASTNALTSFVSICITSCHTPR